MSPNIADPGDQLLTELDRYLHLVHAKVVVTDVGNIPLNNNDCFSSEFSRGARELLGDTSLSETELQKFVSNLRDTVETFRTIGRYFGAHNSSQRSSLIGGNV